MFFTQEVARLGREGAVRAYIDRLAPGVGASAFHGLMRMAYALLRQDDTDVAVALGYWAATYLEMPAPQGGAPRTDDPLDMLSMVAAIKSLADIPIGELLWWNMDGHAKHPDFRPVVDWLAIDDTTLDKMAGASLAIFAATQHFARAARGDRGALAAHRDALLPAPRGHAAHVLALHLDAFAGDGIPGTARCCDAGQMASCPGAGVVENLVGGGAVL